MISETRISELAELCINRELTLAALRTAAREAAIAENEACENLVANGLCQPDCDSYAHSPICSNVYPDAAIRARREGLKCGCRLNHLGEKMHTGKNNRAWHKADKAIANRLELHRLLTSRFVAEGLSAAAASNKAFDLIMLAPANDVRNAIEKLRGDDELLARLHDGLIFPNGTAKPIGGGGEMMEPQDLNKPLRQYRHLVGFDQVPEIGDHIELLGDRFTDKGPCTGIVTNVSGGKTCVKHHDEYFWLPNDRVEVVRVSLHHRTGKTLWIIK